MQIRKIHAEEVDLVVGLFDQYRIFYKQPSDKVLANAFIRERLENNESVIFAAFVQENSLLVPAGFTQLYPKYSSVRAVKNWILNDLYVEEAHRRKGIGKKLIRVAMQFAKEAGSAFVQLETAADNRTAQRVYESIGFVRQEPELDYYVYQVAL